MGKPRHHPFADLGICMMGTGLCVLIIWICVLLIGGHGTSVGLIVLCSIGILIALFCGWGAIVEIYDIYKEFSEEDQSSINK